MINIIKPAKLMLAYIVFTGIVLINLSVMASILSRIAIHHGFSVFARIAFPLSGMGIAFLILWWATITVLSHWREVIERGIS